MINHSYFNGEGAYQDLYDRVFETFPDNPSKENTNEHQQIFALVAATYKAWHEDGIHPLEFVNNNGERYSISKDVYVLVVKYLANAKQDISRSLDKLLDEAIIHAFYCKSKENLINKLKFILTFVNILW